MARTSKGRRRLLVALSVVGVAVIALLAGYRPLLGVRTLAPEGASASANLEQTFGRLLARHVGTDGLVDYHSLAQQRAELAAVVAALAKSGPKLTPKRYASKAQRLAYYINAYNALVLYAVVRHFPINSVHDVRGPIEPRQGMGFFWSLRFRLDGETVHLHGLENDVIRELGDARIHAAINCASMACPRLARSVYQAAKLDAQLDAAAQRFASDSRHVRIDEVHKRIEISAIYQWYAPDFGAKVLDWIERHAREDVKAKLARARAAGYSVTYSDYDWSLNNKR